MTEKDKIRLLLENKKRLIDSILESIDRYENLRVQDIKDLVNLYSGPRFYFHDKEVIEILNEIKERIESTNHYACKFTKDNQGMMQMLISSSLTGETKARDSGLKGIRDFTKGATELIIIDPYLLGGATEDTEKYLDEFKKSSRIDGKTLNRLHIIYSSGHGHTKSIKMGIKRLAEQNDCKISSADTDLIHDRIWIKDKKEAIVVGTSFGGLGNRVCFILELPKYDLDSLLELTTDNDLLTNSFV
jgi:hypothetical protein